MLLPKSITYYWNIFRLIDLQDGQLHSILILFPCGIYCKSKKKHGSLICHQRRHYSKWYYRTRLLIELYIIESDIIYHFNIISSRKWIRVTSYWGGRFTKTVYQFATVIRNFLYGNKRSRVAFHSCISDTLLGGVVQDGERTAMLMTGNEWNEYCTNEIRANS